MDTHTIQLYLFYSVSLLIAVFVGATTQLTSRDATMHMLALRCGVQAQPGALKRDDWQGLLALEHLGTRGGSFKEYGIRCSGRMVLLLGDSLLLYMLTGNNVHMKNNRFGAYLKQFVWFYGSVLAAIVLDFTFGLSVITYVSKGSDHTALTSQQWYWVVNIAMQLAYSVQICLLYTSPSPRD